MNEQLRDQTSAFLDDELPPAESELLVRRLGRDDAMHAAATRYLLIGQALRGEMIGDRPLAFLERLRARMEAEEGEAEQLPLEPDPASATPSPRASRWWRPASGAAAAAAVALLAIVGLQNADRGEVPDAPAMAGAPAASPAAATTTDAEALIRPTPVQAQLQRQAPVQAPIRLTNYLMTHGEVAGTLGRKTIHSGIVGTSAAQIMGTAAERDLGDARAD